MTGNPVVQAANISIHAPTKGATGVERVKKLPTKRFQSTLPRRERQKWGSNIVRLDNDFNPRSHEGSDSYERQHKRGVQHISIHAPTKGATLCHERVSQGQLISIHAPTKGATIMNLFINRFEWISIHAPTKGATW